MKDKKLAETICNVWNEHHTGYFLHADTNAEIEETSSEYNVKISPALHNDGETFLHAEALADVCRAFNVNNYLCVNRFGEIIAYIS